MVRLLCAAPQQVHEARLVEPRGWVDEAFAEPEERGDGVADLAAEELARRVVDDLVREEKGEGGEMILAAVRHRGIYMR